MERLLKEKEARLSAPAVNDELLLDIEPLHISGSPNEPVADAANEVILSELVDELDTDISFAEEKTEQSEIDPSLDFIASDDEEPVVKHLDNNGSQAVQAEILPTISEDTAELLGHVSIEDEAGAESNAPADLMMAEQIIPEGSSIETPVSEPALTGSAYETVADDLSYGDAPSKAISMPMIAGAVGLVLCFVVIGAWYLMGSTTPAGQATPSPAAVLTSEQPQLTSEVPGAVPSDEQVSDTGSNADQESPDSTESVSSTRPDQTTTQRTPTPKPTPQRTPQIREDAPKPTPERRRTVTVDDLINDN
jgi:hypothetical protein